MDQYMQTQNISEPVMFITSASTTFRSMHFKWTMVKQIEPSIKFLQLIDLLHVFQVTLADIRQESKKKERKKGQKGKKENVMTKPVKGLVPPNNW